MPARLFPEGDMVADKLSGCMKMRLWLRRFKCHARLKIHQDETGRVLEGSGRCVEEANLSPRLVAGGLCAVAERRG